MSSVRRRACLNVHVEVVRDDLDTLVMDADVLEDLLSDPQPDKKAKELEIKLVQRIKKHSGDKKFVELGERLERLRERHEQGVLLSLEYLKELAELAKEVVAAEREVVPEEEHDLGKAALTELFEGTRNENTPIIVERVVADIDDIVEKVRFPEWQHTDEGERTPLACPNLWIVVMTTFRTSWSRSFWTRRTSAR